MEQFVERPEPFEAQRWTGGEPPPGVRTDGKGELKAYATRKGGPPLAVSPGDWVVYRDGRPSAVYSDDEFRRRFTPAL